MTSKNTPLDDMKMAMLGFESGFQSANSAELVMSIRKKIAELNGQGTEIP